MFTLHLIDQYFKTDAGSRLYLLTMRGDKLACLLCSANILPSLAASSTVCEYELLPLSYALLSASYQFND